MLYFVNCKANKLVNTFFTCHNITEIQNYNFNPLTVIAYDVLLYLSSNGKLINLIFPESSNEIQATFSFFADRGNFDLKLNFMRFTTIKSLMLQLWIGICRKHINRIISLQNVVQILLLFEDEDAFVLFFPWNVKSRQDVPSSLLQTFQKKTHQLTSDDGDVIRTNNLHIKFHRQFFMTTLYRPILLSCDIFVVAQSSSVILNQYYWSRL